MRLARIIILSVCLSALPYTVCATTARKPLLVAFLDIGQGDAIYIQAPNGNQMIIDGGPGNTLISALSGIIPRGDHSVDVLMVGNTDTDHFSGFIGLLKEYTVGAVLEPGTHPATKTYAALESAVITRAIPHILMHRGDTITLDQEDGVVFKVLFPDRDVSTWKTNDASIMGILSYGKTKIMFTSDGTQKGEAIILSENAPEIVKSDILKVGHHGSATSSSDAFVAAVAPKWGIISSGKDNTYGLPKQVTLDTLTRHGVTIERTDIEGTIIFTSDGEQFMRKK